MIIVHQNQTPAGSITSAKRFDFEGLFIPIISQNRQVSEVTQTSTAENPETTGELVAIRTITSSGATLATTDYNVVCDMDVGPYSINLPAGSNGLSYRINKVGNRLNDLTIVRNGTDKILDDDSDLILTGNPVLIIIFTTTRGWY